MHRLPVERALLAQDRVTPPPDAARHLKVLRPKPGEEIELFDGAGHTRRYAFADGALRALAPERAFPPSAFRLTLFACVTKGSRWDWTVEKAVELGVTAVVPVISQRCIVRLDPAERAAKAERWRRIAEDAARQSDAVWLPEVARAVDFPEALARARTCDAVFTGALADPPPPPLLEAVRACAPRPGAALGFFVGPEGDFTPEELAALLACTHPVSLGPTVLRAETAALFGLSALAAVCHAQTRVGKPQS